MFLWPWELHALGCRVDILGTNCDQCLRMVQCCFTSTETIRLIRTASLGRPPRLLHSSWTLCFCDIFWTLINSFACWFYTGTTGLILFQTVLRGSAPLRWHPVFANVLPKKLATWSWKYMIHDAGMTSNVDLIFSAFTPCSQGFHLQWIMICQTAFLYKSLVGS